MAQARLAPERIRAELERTALGAGPQVRRLFKSGRFDAFEKRDHTLVTEADTGAERFVRRMLGRSYPAVPVVSEEDEARPELAALEDFFLVDPIDGTWNFAAGIPVFFISIAYLHHGLPRAGVMFNPISGQLFSATEGGGAFRTRGRVVPRARHGSARRGIQLRTAPYRPLSECQVHRHDRRLNVEMARRILEGVVLRARGVRDLGSTTAEIALIACGVSDALVGYYVANWDVAAAALILGEAGGVLTNLDGTPVVFTAREKFSVCAAGNRRLHREILSAMRRPREARSGRPAPPVPS